MDDKREKKKHAGLLFSFWWQIWKERNRRIFYAAEQSYRHVAKLVQENLRLQHLAASTMTEEELQ